MTFPIPGPTDSARSVGIDDSVRLGEQLDSTLFADVSVFSETMLNTLTPEDLNFSKTVGTNDGRYVMVGQIKQSQKWPDSISDQWVILTPGDPRSSGAGYKAKLAGDVEPSDTQVVDRIVSGEFPTVMDASGDAIRGTHRNDNTAGGGPGHLFEKTGEAFESLGDWLLQNPDERSPFVTGQIYDAIVGFGDSIGRPLLQALSRSGEAFSDTGLVVPSDVRAEIIEGLGEEANEIFDSLIVATGANPKSPDYRAGQIVGVIYEVITGAKALSSLGKAGVHALRNLDSVKDTASIRVVAEAITNSPPSEVARFVNAMDDASDFSGMPPKIQTAIRSSLSNADSADDISAAIAKLDDWFPGNVDGYRTVDVDSVVTNASDTTPSANDAPQPGPPQPANGSTDLDGASLTTPDGVSDIAASAANVPGDSEVEISLPISRVFAEELIAQRVEDMENTLANLRPEIPTRPIGGTFSIEEGETVYAPYLFPAGIGFDRVSVRYHMSWSGDYVFTPAPYSSPIEYLEQGSSQWQIMSNEESYTLSPGTMIRFQNTGSQALDHVITLPETVFSSGTLSQVLESETPEQYSENLFKLDPRNLNDAEKLVLIRKADRFDQAQNPDNEYSVSAIRFRSDASIKRYEEWNAGLPQNSLANFINASNSEVPMLSSERFTAYQQFMELWESSDTRNNVANLTLFERSNSIHQILILTSVVRDRLEEMGVFEAAISNPNLAREDLRGPINRLNEFLNSSLDDDARLSARDDVMNQLLDISSAIREETIPFLADVDIKILNVIANDLGFNFIRSDLGTPDQSFDPTLPTIEINNVEQFDENFLPIEGSRAKGFTIRLPSRDRN